MLLISSELPPKPLQCVRDIEHKWWWRSKWGLQEPSRACKSSVKAAGDVCEYVISTGSLKGRQSLREHRKQNTQWTSCWVAALFHLLVQPIFWSVMCVCVWMCLFAGVWGRFKPSRLERLSRGDPAHSWTPPLTVPQNFLLWLGLWGVEGQQEGCFLPRP